MGEVVFQCSFFFVFKCLDETVKKKKKKKCKLSMFLQGFLKKGERMVSISNSIIFHMRLQLLLLLLVTSEGYNNKLLVVV